MRRESRRSGSAAGDRALPAAIHERSRAGASVVSGGLVGYFGYDTVRYTESKLMDSCPPDELGVPDILLVLAEEVLIFDGLRGTSRWWSMPTPLVITPTRQPLHASMTLRPRWRVPTRSLARSLLTQR